MCWAAMKEKRGSKTEGNPFDKNLQKGLLSTARLLDSTFFHIHLLYQPLAGKCSQVDLFLQIFRLPEEIAPPGSAVFAPVSHLTSASGHYFENG